MPTYWTKTLIPTARQVPAEAEVPSHRLMLRAGYIRKLGAGAYSYLPLGLRSLHKAGRIVREEMDATGAAEVLLPALQPLELWQRTGRDVAYGDNLFTLKDRHGRTAALGPTHEEVVTDLLGACISSYKDLPKTVYQIQTKFRDEFRPRFGVLRSREFLMKDAYSFHTTLEGPGGLGETYDAMYAAYCKIFDRCGVPYRIVEAEAGPIGGDASHEFMVPSPTGEDTILHSDTPGSDGSSYAANVEKCEIGPRKHDLETEPTGELEDVHTPDCPGIEDVCAFFKKKLGSKLAKKNMLKTLVCRDADGTWVLGVVRGDHDLNEAKLGIPLADEAQARHAGFSIGFVGPHIASNRDDTRIVVDPDAARGGFWVTGANRADHHVKHFNWKRDVIDAISEDRVQVKDIRNALAGDPSPKNDGGTLQESKGIEVGHVFKLGSKYTQALGVSVLDENNRQAEVLMGCYGIGVNRILAAAIENPAGHDDDGIIWPRALAPFDILITPIKYEGEVKATIDTLAAELEAAGYDVLIDDRADRPGPKFKDGDLIGLPLRLTVGDKGLKSGEVELKRRDGSTGDRGEMVKLDAATARVARLLA